jgi:hypothetical protein
MYDADGLVVPLLVLVDERLDLLERGFDGGMIRRAARSHVHSSTI